MKKDFIDRYNEYLQDIRQVELDYAKGKISLDEHDRRIAEIYEWIDDLKRS